MNADSIRAVAPLLLCLAGAAAIAILLILLLDRGAKRGPAVPEPAQSRPTPQPTQPAPEPVQESREATLTDDLQTAISLIESGSTVEAGVILSALVKNEPDNEVAWRWLSGCVVPEEQKRYCLSQVLRINPENEQARKMLAALDFQPVFEPPSTAVPVATVIRPGLAQPDKWMVAGLSLYTIGSILGLIGFVILACVCLSIFLAMGG